MIDEPEWVIDGSGAGGFRVACDCGWSRSGFDTASLARAAASEHQARPDGSAGGSSSTAGDAPARKRWWQRG